MLFLGHGDEISLVSLAVSHAIRAGRVPRLGGSTDRGAERFTCDGAGA